MAGGLTAVDHVDHATASGHTMHSVDHVDHAIMWTMWTMCYQVQTDSMGLAGVDHENMLNGPHFHDAGGILKE